MATTYNNNLGTNTPRARGDYDAAHMSAVTPGEDLRSVMINRIAWGPVFSGVAIALVTQFVLNMIGVGVGVASLQPDTTSNWAVANLSLGTAIWWTVSGILASYCGGYAAGRLSGDPVESTAGWHGLVAWAATVLVLVSLVSAGSGMAMSGMLGTTNTNAYTRGQAAAPAATATVPGSTAEADTATPDLAADDMAPGTTMSPMEDTATPNTSATDTSAADTRVQVPVATANTVDNATLSRYIMQGSLLSAIALVLGALAAWFGGRAGTIQPTITTTTVVEGKRLH